jgi:hypothetical protein
MNDFYDDATPVRSARPRGDLGPIFTATYESDAACCSEVIQPGEDIRADGRGGWIHADDQCEEIALIGTRPAPSRTTGQICPRCWFIHGPGQQECA